MTDDGATAVPAERDFDVAASEQELGDDPLGDGVRRRLRAGHVDRLHRRVGPFGRCGLDQARETSAPGASARTAGGREVAAGVLQGHEDAVSALSRATLREDLRGRQRRSLDLHRLVLGVSRHEAAGEDDPRGVAGGLRDDPRVDSARGQSRRDPPADASLVVHDFDPAWAQEPGEREAGWRRDLEHRGVARDAWRRRRDRGDAGGRVTRRRHSFFFARPSLSENFSMKPTTSRSVLRLATSSRFTSLMSGI